MAISELIDLIELTRKLASRKSELDREYFETFIEPVWIAFSKVHLDYMKSLEEYENLLSNDRTTISVLTDKIQKDSLLTGDIRSDLYALIENVPSIIFRGNPDYLSNFTNNIVRYVTFRIFESTNEGDYRKMPPMSGNQFPFLGTGQRIRTTLLVYLSRKGNETNRAQAKHMVLRMVQELQNMYSDVSRSYGLLRLRLLK